MRQVANFDDIGRRWPSERAADLRRMLLLPAPPYCSPDAVLIAKWTCAGEKSRKGMDTAQTHGAFGRALQY